MRDCKLLCFGVSFVSIIIWYYVIATIVENLGDIMIIISYALGFAAGDVLAIYFDNYLEKIAKSRGLRIRKKRKVKRQGKKK